MKKQDILRLLEANSVTSNNLKSFISKQRKAVKEKLSGNFDKIHKWLFILEAGAAEVAHKKSLKRQARRFNMSVVKYTQLQEKAEFILDLFDTGHSMGCYKKLEINGKVFAVASSCSTYANSCTWKPTHGNVVVNMNKKQLQECQLINGGVITLNKYLKATGNKSNYSVNWADRN